MQIRRPTRKLKPTTAYKALLISKIFTELSVATYLRCSGIFNYCFIKQELIRRRDSERELFYDHIVQYFKI